MNNFEFIIRKASHEDIERIAFINAESWKTTYQGIVTQLFLDTLTTEQQLPRAKRLLESPEISCIVAYDKHSGLVAGFACFGKNREPNVDADCELQAIYLLQEYQGLGIGKTLFQFGFKELIEKFNKKMMVSVFEANKIARDFYERQGGKLIGSDHVDLAGVRYPTSTYIWNLQ